jgi:flagellar biosynthetic protein FliR
MTFSFFTLEDLVQFFFLTLRVGAIVMTLPFLGSRSLPGHFKILSILFLSGGLYPVVQAQSFPMPPSLLSLGLLMLGEICIGLMIGFVAQVLFTGIQFGGEIINQQMGLGLANIFDPDNGQQNSIVTNFQYILAVLIFFSGNVHHWFIYAMAESLHTVPLLGFTLTQSVVMSLVTLLGNACMMAIKIAAPVIATLFLTTLAMGLVARLAPQMNIFMLSLPATLGVGLLVLAWALPYVLGGLRILFEQLGRDFLLVIRLLGKG